jgi:hypothetical protein
MRLCEFSTGGTGNGIIACTLYIKGEKGKTPEGTGEKKFLSDYQKKNPPVK